jgi:hypothetical protein
LQAIFNDVLEKDKEEWMLQLFPFIAAHADANDKVIGGIIVSI